MSTGAVAGKYFASELRSAVGAAIAGAINVPSVTTMIANSVNSFFTKASLGELIFIGHNRLPIFIVRWNLGESSITPIIARF